MSDLISLAEIYAARERIAGVAVRTPLVRLEPERLRAAGLPVPEYAVYLKAESAQPIGSFKLRGAYNMAAQLPEAVWRNGLITYSSGNHAQGVAYAARALGTKAVIVMPENAPQVKIDATRALGAEIVMVGNASSDRRRKAEELAEEFGYAIIPPYDAAEIIAGQATCGLEIAEQLPGVDLVVAPVSGGGLLSGVATAVKLAKPGTGVQVWGAEPELAADAKESFDTGRLMEWPAAKTSRTIGDGLRTQSLGALNFAHIRRFVDGIVTVTEDEIFAAMRVALAATDLVIEPSGAVSLAALLYGAERLPRASSVVAVVSGGNVDPVLRQQLEKEIAAGARR